MSLSSVLHDLGLTDYAPGPHRFEIEVRVRRGYSLGSRAYRLIEPPRQPREISIDLSSSVPDATWTYNARRASVVA